MLGGRTIKPAFVDLAFWVVPINPNDCRDAVILGYSDPPQPLVTVAGKGFRGDGGFILKHLKDRRHAGVKGTRRFMPCVWFFHFIHC